MREEYNLMGGFGDENEGLESYILSTMTQAEKEEYKREVKAVALNKLGLSVVSVPNKRSVAQKLRHKNNKLNQDVAKRLASAWNCKYKLNTL